MPEESLVIISFFTTEEMLASTNSGIINEIKSDGEKIQNYFHCGGLHFMAPYLHNTEQHKVVAVI